SHERQWNESEQRLFEEIGWRLTDALSSLLAQRDLRISEEKYRRIFETASEGIWEQDENLRTSYVNKLMADMIGYSVEELEDRLVTDFMFEEDIDDHLLRTENRKKGLAEVYERRFRKKDGTTLWTLLSATPVFEGDHFKGSFAMFTDITPRIHMEEALRRSKENLEETVQQRTDELRLARDAAEAANKAKSIFLANMSHELRTPLNAILGFSQMMRQNPGLDHEQHETLEIINHSGEHLLKLINDVLEIAKIEAGKLQLENAPLDLHALVREVSDMMRLRAQQKGLQLQLDQSSGFPRYIKGDEARLRQILVNLVSNAVKFTAQGSVIIRLNVKNNDWKHDTGPGISEKDQQHLFKPFAQLAEGDRQEGSGLGLSIVRQFVQLMGGNISIDSTPGKGSVFRIELPLDNLDEMEMEAVHPGNVSNGEILGLEPGQSHYRIAIAEDQRDNQILLSRLMTNIGLDARVAENGEECVKLFEEWHPDLIWMDWRMPVMDGAESTQRIRQLPGGDKVKIVAVTASAFKEQKPKLLAAGIDDYVRKPYRFNAGEGTDTPPPHNLTPQMLATLTKELRHQLSDAIRSLDSNRIKAVIEYIGNINTPLGKSLGHLADEFNYPMILQALSAVTDSRPQDRQTGDNDDCEHQQ
ncbi:MAG: ATP-binding protein, partial [Candidatus Thiodiazotropha sp.]